MSPKGDSPRVLILMVSIEVITWPGLLVLAVLILIVVLTVGVAVGWFDRRRR